MTVEATSSLYFGLLWGRLIHDTTTNRPTPKFSKIHVFWLLLFLYIEFLVRGMVWARDFASHPAVQKKSRDGRIFAVR